MATSRPSADQRVYSVAAPYREVLLRVHEAAWGLATNPRGAHWRRELRYAMTQAEAMGLGAQARQEVKDATRDATSGQYGGPTRATVRLVRPSGVQGLGGLFSGVSADLGAVHPPPTGTPHRGKNRHRNNQPGYHFYVVRVRPGANDVVVLSGWEYREDANDNAKEMQELPHLKQWIKVYTAAYLRTLGVDVNDDRVWGSV